MEIRCPLCYSWIDEKESNCHVCGAELKRRKTSNLRLIIVPIIIIMLILSAILIVILIQKIEDTQQPEGIEIDGDFSDWSNVAITSDTGEALPFNLNVDIVDYGVDGSLSELSFYLKVYGKMLDGEPESSGRNMDTAYIFIDTDRFELTGYFINGIGADYMLEVYGWGGEIWDSSRYSYSSQEQDWNLWEQEGSVAAAITGSELEAQVDYGALGLEDHDTVDVLFYIQSWDRFEDFSDTVISNEKGVLLVSQRGVGEGYITGVANSLLRLDLRALNEEIVVRSIKFTRIGKGSDNDVSAVKLIEGTRPIDTGTLVMGVAELQPDILLREGESKTLYLEVDINPGAQTENTIGFRIAKPRDITIDKGAITLRNTPPEKNYYDVSYITRIPTDIMIDGAFADWERKDVMDDNKFDIHNNNLDIVEYGVSNTTEMVSFYLKVSGKICFGTPVPSWDNAITPSQRTGEDVFYIYIDSDNESTTGYSIGGIGADYLIEIKGRYGEIISKRYMGFLGSLPFEWLWNYEGDVDAMTDTSGLEIQVLKSSLEITGYFKVYFESRDWDCSNKDLSENKIIR